MNDRIRHLLDQISALEEDLSVALHDQEANAIFEIKGKRVEFEHSIREAHRRLKTGFFRWVVAYRPQNLITGPIIYAMLLPMLVLDLCVSFYQATCFPIYGVAKVRRADYIVFDRQQLEYLNFVEKFHCTYCAYGSGLIAYVAEIVARTEEYFCPIKHARKMLGTNVRYARFLDYGDAVDYEVRLEKFRVGLGAKK
ncbi:MAG: hypothetical protein M0P95_11560 [Sulfuritalea sp.]|jgi:hypothetical protein|nr:hypothetical protein [Sulfuritalea sp.]